MQGCEMAGSSVEEQLDRAMAWACVGTSPNSTVGGGSSRVIGIPTEFHEHLRRRRQLLWTGQEQAANILRLSGAVLEFEDSREGFLSSAAGRHLELSNSINEAGRVWQHTYHNMVARLESACLLFTNSEMEWQSAQKSIEAANLCLSSALDELNLVSGEATTLSGI
jgi:PI-3-kinase-related kinase SMG-1